MNTLSPRYNGLNNLFLDYDIFNDIFYDYIFNHKTCIVRLYVFK